MNESITIESLDRKVEGYRESTVKRFNIIDQKIDEGFLFMKAGFERMDRGFEKMDERMNQIDERMARMDDRQDSFEAKLDDFMLMIQRIFMAKGQDPFAGTPESNIE